MKRIAVLALAGFLVAAAPAPSSLSSDIERDYRTNLERLFIHFHRNPELSYMETRTAARMAQELRGLGLQVTERVGGTGVVAVLRNGAGPTVLLRADMDGLPVQERSGLSYASVARQKDKDGVERPVMHACGHDTHITALVGAARQLIARKDRWAGTVVFVVQPAEERLGGAKAMIDDGLYTRFPKPDYALAFHADAQSLAGSVGIAEGIVASSSDSVDIKVRGVGAHGASPHRGVDPVLVASQIVVSLQSLVARNIDPLQPGVVTVGSIHGGSKHNIIGEEVDLQITVRADTPEVRKQLVDGIRRIADGVARAHGVPENLLPIVTARTENTPPTLNDPATARRLTAAVTREMGAARLSHEPREGMGAEDFAYFVAPEHGVKGVYMSVGGTPQAALATAASHHSPLFKIEPEPVVRTGAELMAVATMELLAKP